MYKLSFWQGDSGFPTTTLIFETIEAAKSEAKKTAKKHGLKKVSKYIWYKPNDPSISMCLGMA